MHAGKKPSQLYSDGLQDDHYHQNPRSRNSSFLKTLILKSRQSISFVLRVYM